MISLGTIKVASGIKKEVKKYWTDPNLAKKEFKIDMNQYNIHEFLSMSLKDLLIAHSLPHAGKKFQRITNLLAVVIISIPM